MASLADPLTVLETYNPESPRPGIRAWSAGVVRYKNEALSLEGGINAQARGRGRGDLRSPREQEIGLGDRRGCRGGYPAPLWFLRQVHHLPHRVSGGRAREDDQGGTRSAGEAQSPRAGQALVPDSKRPRQEGAGIDDRQLHRPRRSGSASRAPHHTRTRVGG